MTIHLPKTKEQFNNHIPARKTLLACGWHCLPAEDNLIMVLNERLRNFALQKHFCMQQLLTGIRRVKVIP